MVREELEPHLKITLVAILSTLADYATTQIALKYPELREANPNVNFGLEFTLAEAGGVGLYSLGKALKQKTDLSLVIGLVPAATPFAAAINNLGWILYAHRKYYPWEECSILFPEEHIS